MNIDANNIKNAIFSSAEMASSASATQAKRFAGSSSSSFQDEMKASKTDDVNEVKESTEAKQTEKASETKKTEQKSSKKVEDKTLKETNKEETQTITGEIAVSEQQDNSYNGQQNNQNQNAYSALSEQVQAYIQANGGQFNFASVNAMAATSRNQLTGINASVDYSSVKMSDTDAKFFADLVSKTDMSMGSVAAEFQKALQNSDVKMVQSTAKASAALIEALKESSKTNQPFRIDFDKDVSVILQVDRTGKINANFIPGDQAVENYLRNNIDFLKQRFNEENIDYGELSYSQSRRNKDEQQRRKNNKEGGNE